MTENQVEKLNVGVWSAVGLGTLLIVQAVAGAMYLSGRFGEQDQSLAILKQEIAQIQRSQEEAQIRTASRQQEVQDQLDVTGQLNRERAEALEGRIRPLEQQAAATMATLQSISNSLQTLVADVRDLRTELRPRSGTEN